ncbi:expressed unknown protein [Seminavis robusta]|uniref:Uncharacterized protein n=1 Tax=Seminavis robusta TaxID=568900 RepID=A0A9N8D7J9_9STRA|nr:expressed unknown protein [Seminavis robusta]|eukprot:Sro21_g014760.1 n/a (317) ;mRNA; r:91310-92260
MTSSNSNSKNNMSIEEQAHNLRLADGDLHAEAQYQPNASTNSNHDNNSTPTTTTTTTTTRTYPYRFIPLCMGGNTHMVSTASRALLQQEVSLQDLQTMTELFYEKAFQDPTLDQFIRAHEDPHGARFAKWIHQKLSGSSVWDADRRLRDKTPVLVAGGRHAIVVHDRSSAHAAAWHSPKRPRHSVGRHFQLDECRVWMRLHFWALRESGLLQKSPTFADYYVRFIGHFVRVYERLAPAFARDSFRWSANANNIRRYLKAGRRMKDVLGLSPTKAMKQIPMQEYQDPEWPYHQTPPTENSETDDDDEKNGAATSAWA